MRKSYLAIITGAGLLGTLMLTGAAVASTNTSVVFARGHMRGGKPGFMGMNKPAAVGTVTAISGSTITINGKDNITYTIDAASAKISQGFGASATTLTIADIKVGDSIVVQGTVAGTSVTATTIMDGIPTMPMHQPMVGGVVAGVNGNSFTVTVQAHPMRKNILTAATPATQTFTVNTNSATTYTKDGKIATLADVTAGERIMIAGAVDKTALTVAATKVDIHTLNPGTIKKPIGMMRGFRKGMIQK